MKVSEIAFVGYPVTDIPRARKFYEEVIGLKVETDFSDDKFTWIEYDIAGATLAISNAWKPTGVEGGPGVAFEVEDFDAALARLKEHGVAFDGPNEFPTCKMALTSDPDGNGLVIHKRNPDYKPNS